MHTGQCSVTSARAHGGSAAGLPKRAARSPGLAIAALIALVIAFALLASAPSAKDKDKDKASAGGLERSTGVWRAVYSDFPPFSETDANGRPVGFAIDILEAAARAQGATVSFLRVNNPAEAITAIAEGRADMHPHLTPTAERQATLAFTRPIETLRILPFARAGTQIPADWRSRPAIRVGATDGSAPLGFARRSDLGPIVARDNFELLSMLAAGRIDIALYAEPGFSFVLRAIGAEDSYVAAGPPLLTSAVAMGVARNDASLLASLDAGLAELENTQAYWTIHARWFGEREDDSPLRRGLLAVAGVVAASASSTAAYYAISARRTRLRAEHEAIKARTAHSEAMAETIVELQSRERDMRRLLAVVSHDLRSPLVSISGFLEMLREATEANDPEGAREAYDRASRNILHMRQLISGIVDLKSIDAEGASFTEVDLDDVVLEVRDALHERLERVSARLKIAPLGTHVLDRGMIGRVLQNLVSNAAHHACKKPGALIEIEARRLDGALLLTVSDEGPGVPELYRDRIWRIGHRIDPSSGGMGLGLSVVARIAAIHGGRAWVDTGRRGGASFTVSIPRDCATRPRLDDDSAALQLPHEAA